jgi:phosphoglycolate phosphatase
MSQSSRAILFDLDGTLIDTAPDFALVLNQLRDQHSLEPLPFSAIRETVSQGAKALVTLAFDKSEGDEGFDTLRQALLDLYSQHLAVESCLFPELDQLLDWMGAQNLPWGIVTNKPSLYAEPIIEALNLSDRCGVLICPDHVSNTKPDPEPLLLACERLNCDPLQSVYIGDHRRDIEAGHNASMTTIATAYGYINSGESISDWNAHHCVEHPKELLPLLQGLLSLK